MLGRSVEDDEGVEAGGRESGLGILPVDTALGREKIRTVYSGTIEDASGVLSNLKGISVSG